MILMISALAISPLKSEAAGSISRDGTESNGVEIWRTSGTSSASDPIRIPAGSYGNGITASLISLKITNGSFVKISGPHTFYNLTIDTGAVLSGDPLSDGINYPRYGPTTYPYLPSPAESNAYPVDTITNPDYNLGGSFPLTASGINKKIDISVIGILTLNGTVIADGLGYEGGYAPPTKWPLYCMGYKLDGRCGGQDVNFSQRNKWVAVGVGRGGGPGGGAHLYPSDNSHVGGAGGSFGGVGSVGYWDHSQPSGYCTNGSIPDSWAKPGPTYGSVGDFGSGGGYANYNTQVYNANGGAGGGAIKIKAQTINMGNNGRISANGAKGQIGPGGQETSGGSGSGGSISILFNDGQIYSPVAKAGAGGCGSNISAQDGVVNVGVSTSKILAGTRITANGGDAATIWNGMGGGGRVTVSTLPTLTADLTANPSTGASPLNTTLTATVGGTATGTVNYSFWWNCTNSSTSVSDTIAACGNPSNSAIGAKMDGVNAITQAVTHSYAAEGTFSPKVIIERGEAFPVEAKSAVVVTSSKPLVCAKYGDINDDGKIGHPDANMISSFLTGTALTDEQKKRADVDNSGTVTAADRQLIIDYLNGTATTFPVCNLSANLVAKPSSGYAPLGVELQGTAGNIAPTANSTYYFWWNCNNSSKNYDEVVAACQAPSAKIENVSGSVPLQKVSHQYDAVGSYKPKLLIVRDGVLSAQSITTITATEKPAPPVNDGGTIVFEGGNTAQAITIRGSLVSDKIEFNPRKKTGLGIKSRFSISIYNDASVLNAHLPIFDGIMDVVVK